MVGAVRDLEGRPRRLGRDRRRLPRRRLHRQARRRRRLAARRLPRARAARRAGGRADRQLVEPGALRQADRSPWGLEIDPAHRPLATHRPGDVPPGVPLRGDLEPVRGRPPRLRRSSGASIRGRRGSSRSTSRSTRSGGSGSSSSASTPPTTSSACGSTPGSRGSSASPALVWFWLSQRRRSRPKKHAAAQPPGPKMAVPKGRVRPGG